MLCLLILISLEVSSIDESIAAPEDFFDKDACFLEIVKVKEQRDKLLKECQEANQELAQLKKQLEGLAELNSQLKIAYEDRDLSLLQLYQAQQELEALSIFNIRVKKELDAQIEISRRKGDLLNFSEKDCNRIAILLAEITKA